uniref:Uncharacterized protein n=1 Tax=Caenorhabditis japonica TaxID=281687 RepID=A0A8R1EDD9_CAEJA
MVAESWSNNPRKLSLGAPYCRSDATSTPSLDAPQKTPNRRFSLAATFLDAAKSNRKSSLFVGKYISLCEPIMI